MNDQMHAFAVRIQLSWGTSQEVRVQDFLLPPSQGGEVTYFAFLGSYFVVQFKTILVLSLFQRGLH
jgi:hypothetical protein